MKNVFKFGAMALGLAALMSQSAHAASSWNVQFSGTGANDSLGDPIATTSYTNGGVTATLSGAYATNGTSNTGFSGTWTTSGAAATVNYYSGYGLGMDSDGNQAPNHAIDNNGNTEAILLHFSTPVVLSQLGLGYISGDADVSVLAYSGSATNPLSGVTAANTLTTTGWSLVGNYANLTVDTTNPYTSVNSSNTASSWWLISAYNTAFGSACANCTQQNGYTLSEGNDYFKIFAVAGTTPTTGKTPEPGSLALAGVALVGAVWTRRRNRKA